MESKEITIVKSFIDAINQGNVTQLSDMMTEDHTLIDTNGKISSGRENMIRGWEAYFRSFPDYNVKVESILQDGKIIAVFGSCFGTYNGKRGLVPENRIEMPAAWKAIVKNDKIKLWQVYADWTEGLKIIDEDSKSG